MSHFKQCNNILADGQQCTRQAVLADSEVCMDCIDSRYKVLERPRLLAPAGSSR